MKVGLIGCGGMGNVHNLSLKALSEKMDIEVTAISDCRPEFLEKAALQWPNAKKYPMGMELIEAGDIDLVHICLPSYLHFEHAYAAMEKGIHVFIEKPVCLTEEDGNKLLDLEEKTGVSVMVGQVVRGFKEYKFLKDCYDTAQYGKLKSIVMQRVGGNPKWGFENWFHDVKRSGSVILDLHIHDVDFLRYMIGEPLSVTTKHTTFDSGMPNQILATFQFKDTFASVEGLWDISTDMPFEASYRACFEEATVIYNGSTVFVYPKNGSTITPNLEPEYQQEDNSTGINISDIGPYYSEIKYFLECLKEKKPNTLAPLSEGVKSVKLALKELKEAMM